MRRAAVVFFVLATAASSALAGVYYTATTRTEGGRRGQGQDSVVKAWVSGDKTKVQFESSNGPMMKKGSYLVTSNAGKEMYLVNPEDKSYSKFDMDGMMQMAGGAMKMMNMKYSDLKMQKVAEEPDGLVAGLPTIHYTFHTSYTMSMNFMGMAKTTRVVKEEEVWATSKLIEAALGLWLRKTPPKMGDETLDSLVKAEMSKIQGFPLKHKTVTTSTDEKGKAEVTTTTLEVTEMQMTGVPDSTFAIPDGYKETSMMGGDESNPFAKMMGGQKKN
jgi:Domain of unknown function (DUF4412)